VEKPTWTDPGLRLRLNRIVRQIADQHRALRPLFERVQSSLDGGDRRDSSEALQGYRRAIGAHFELEEEVFFPAFHGLHPDWSEELDALHSEHRSLRDALADLEGRLHGHRTREGPELLTHFATLLADHEAREERLVATLHATLADAPS
jgi:hypothetical protein